MKKIVVKHTKKYPTQELAAYTYFPHAKYVIPVSEPVELPDGTYMSAWRITNPSLEDEIYGDPDYDEREISGELYEDERQEKWDWIKNA